MKDITNKIQKLLIMAENGTENERKIAMIKAQKLLLDYRLEIADVLGVKKEEVVEVLCSEEVNCYTGWIMKLSDIIPKNFRCKPLYTHVKRRKGKMERLWICGLKKDAEICKDIMEFAVEIAKKESKKIVNYYNKRNESSKGIKQAFMDGFCEGIKEGFYQQILKNEKFSLVVVVPQEVEDFCALKKTANIKSLYIPSAEDLIAKHLGYQNGMKVATGTYDQKYLNSQEIE